MRWLEILILSLVTFLSSLGEEGLSTAAPPNTSLWNGTSFPNPQSEADLKKCFINQKSALCDPDNILTENARNNIIKYFEKIQKLTTKNNGTNECENHGIVGGVAIAKNFVGGNSQTLKPQTQNILRRWNLDPNCGKSFIIVLATVDRSVWVAEDLRLPVTSTELNEIFDEEKDSNRKGDYENAILNMLDETAKRALNPSTSSSQENNQQRQVHVETQHTRQITTTTHSGGGKNDANQPNHLLDEIIVLSILGILICAFWSCWIYKCIKLLCCCGLCEDDCGNVGV